MPTAAEEGSSAVGRVEELIESRGLGGGLRSVRWEGLGLGLDFLEADPLCAGSMKAWFLGRRRADCWAATPCGGTRPPGGWK